MILLCLCGYFCRMTVDILIIGQGICGTMLSHYLEKSGLSFLVIDECKPLTPSRIAAGIVNPVTGRRIVKTWMIDELMPFAWNEYKLIGKELNIQCIAQKKIIDFFPSAQMLDAFMKRYEEDKQYLAKPEEDKTWNEFFNFDFGYGEIQPCYLIDIPALLTAYRNKLINEHQLKEERFIIEKLIVDKNKIVYHDIHASKIIFCDGIAGFENPYFKNLPFAPNKGEVLIIEADLPANEYIYKKGMALVPWNDLQFWVGSSYEWEFKNDNPTETFRNKTESLLKQWLKIPFKIINHYAAVRPATLERRPFVGFHPTYKNIGIFNGMGTKGCSLAPFFANQLCQSLYDESLLMPEVNVRRFSKILGRDIATPGD